ncbi:MAG: hypothetical protein IJQ13_04620 [Prevotella sp.]|nr:hypothetical protein [Prevotella sp.]
MKHKGSISHTYKRRDAVVIPFLFRKAKMVAEYPTNTHKLFKIAADLPVDRFYISDDAALRYIRKRYYKGKHDKFRSKYKERLFEALYDLVCDMMNDDRYKSKGLATTTMLALLRPAPCVGLTPNEIYLRHLNLRGCNRKKEENEKV